MNQFFFFFYRIPPYTLEELSFKSFHLREYFDYFKRFLFCTNFPITRICDKIVETLYTNRGNFGGQNNPHPFALPSIQSGACCFLQVTALTAAHHSASFSIEGGFEGRKP